MFFNKSVTLIRTSAGHYTDDGQWQNGATEEMTIQANVQPLNQRELEQYTSILPGGNRTIMLVKVYTSEQLLLDEQMTGQVADVIEWLGKKYKIAMQEQWQSNIISHFRYIGVEVVENEFNS